MGGARKTIICMWDVEHVSGFDGKIFHDQVVGMATDHCDGVDLFFSCFK